jgi:hypothetical protein
VNYFGTLARSTDHYHYGIYASDLTYNDTKKAKEEVEYHMNNQGRSKHARSQNITLIVHIIDYVVSGVEELTERFNASRTNGTHLFV